MKLKEVVEKYDPWNEQEVQDKKVMLSYLKEFDNYLTRDNKFGHFTASAWVVNPQKTKVLMIYHNIYQSWAWTGGHADGQEDLFQVAIRELKEETGIQQVKVLQEAPISLEILTVNGHRKRGEWVSSHTHLNLTYLFEVDEKQVLKIKEGENSGVQWIDLKELPDKISKQEGWILDNIYEKIIQKLSIHLF